MLQEKRENRRQTHLYNMDIRTSSGCPEQCWFQPIPHLHLPLESNIWMDCTHVQKHLIFLYFFVLLKPSWWIWIRDLVLISIIRFPLSLLTNFAKVHCVSDIETFWCPGRRGGPLPQNRGPWTLRFPQALSTVLPFWNGLFLKPRASVIGKSRQKHNL